MPPESGPLNEQQAAAELERMTPPNAELQLLAERHPPHEERSFPRARPLSQCHEPMLPNMPYWYHGFYEKARS